MGSHKKRLKYDIDGETICLTVIAIILVYIFWKKYGYRWSFKRKEDYDKQKTVIKYLPSDDSIAMIKSCSGLGLSVVHFVLDDYPGFCCTSCGPIFHITLMEREDGLVCRCGLCSMELSSEEKKQIELFTNELHSRRKLGNSLVMCSNNSRGCNVVLPLKELKKHIQHCRNTKIPCPRTCGVAVERHCMEHHIKLCMHRDRANEENNPPYPTPLEPLPQPVPSCPPPPYEMKF